MSGHLGDRLTVDDSGVTPARTPPSNIPSSRPAGSAAGTWGEHHENEAISVSAGLRHFDKLATSSGSPKISSKGPSSRPNTAQSASRKNAGAGDSAGEQLTEKLPMEGSDVPGRQGTYGEIDSGEHPETFEQAEHDLARVSSRVSETRRGSGSDEEKGEAAYDGFDLRAFIEDRQAENLEKLDKRPKSLGVSWRDLRVAAPGGGSAMFVKTFPEAVMGTFGPDLYRLVVGTISGIFAKRDVKAGKVNLESTPGLRNILAEHDGVLKPGEMLLVLGRPGSGCSTFLRAITASLPGSLIMDPNSQIDYGGFTTEEIQTKFRGEVVYSGEDDLHYPELTVGQTLNFAVSNKVPRSEKRIGSRSEFVNTVTDVLLKVFGISHVKGTRVGDAYSRGVSGGERKRVTITEALITRATVLAWDNSTRGLDASTAVDYARSLKLFARLQTTSATLATLYQVSETIYECFDKVLVMDEGRPIYYGPSDKAREYFQELGFYAPARQTTADFLTGITDPNEVRFKEGWEHRAPRTTEDRVRIWKESKPYNNLLREMDEWDESVKQSERADAMNMKAVFRSEKNKGAMKGSIYTVSFPQQILACAKRQMLIKWGQRQDQYVKMITIIIVSVVVSSAFYGEGRESAGAYSRGGLILFGCIFNGWMQLAEGFEAVAGRPIIQKHKTFGFHRPSAMVIARALTDIPILLVQCLITSSIFYWIGGLRPNPGGFFVFYLFSFLSAYNLTALYRFFAAFSPSFNEAIRFSVLGLNVILVFTGYILHRPQMNWMKFFSYINGISYSFESLLVNEFRGDITCSPQQIVPFSMEMNTQYQSCNIQGSRPGTTLVSSADYLGETFDYHAKNLWRNFGVVIAFSALYLLVSVIAAEYLPMSGGDGGGATIFARTKRSKKAVAAASTTDVETGPKPPAADQARLSEKKSDETIQHTASDAKLPSAGAENNADDSVKKTADESHPALDKKPIFTWSKINYNVNGKHLLRDVSGYVRPGRMTALMGASGAGKTTLLTTLAQRQTTGVVSGEMLVDGRPLARGFQKGAGFALQGDVHLATQTVRDAIEFSAFLRQPREVSNAAKMEDVEYILDLLELRDLEDALIGVPGAGLGVERRKRVTIAVELAAKPDVLLFLDEPTSGLDSAGAASIVRLMRKLAADGQSILCTIHQPSALLFESFDDVLLLAPGGQTAYFGPLSDKPGKDSNLIREYFESQGAAKCPPDVNVAEYILELTAGDRSGKMDWGKRWRESIHAEHLEHHIAELVQERSKRPHEANPAADREFSANLPTQIAITTKRLFLNMYRDAPYPYGAFFSFIMTGLVMGLAFQHTGTSPIDLQKRVFTSFLIMLNFPAIYNAVLAKFFEVRALFEGREGPSKTYSWVALVTSFIITSIPLAAVAATLFFLPSFFLVNYSRASSVAGFVYFITLLFSSFQVFFTFALAAMASTPTIASYILPFLLTAMATGNGVFVPPTQLPSVWRDFIYHVVPTTYYVGGYLGATIHGLNIVCKDTDLVKFYPPPNMNCGDYASGWISQIGMGYLQDNSSTTLCEYCPYRTGDEFLQTVSIQFSDRWADFGYFCAYIVFNIFLAYFTYYLFRVRGVSIGMPSLSMFRRKK